MHAFEAHLAALAGRTNDARRMAKELDATPVLSSGSILSAVAAALKVGEIAIAVRILNRTVFQQLAPTSARLDPTLHAALDQPLFAPRRRDATLVWPLEAPMMAPSVHGLFREVRIESGLAEGSDIVTTK
jgi:hypothetical protein